MQNHWLEEGREWRESKRRRKKNESTAFFFQILGLFCMKMSYTSAEYLRKALKVSDILFLVASRVDINKRHRLMLPLLEYTSYAKQSLALFLTVCSEEQDSQVQPNIYYFWHRYGFLMMANSQSKFRSVTWQRKDFVQGELRLLR